MKFSTKAVCTATLLALGVSAHAERVIVTYDGNNHDIKKGHKVKAQGKNWFAVELDENGKKNMRGKKGFKNIEVDAKRFPLAIYNDDPGNPDLTQVTPYGVYQSQADQLTLQPGQKVCVIDSGIAGSQGETGGQNQDFDWSVITGDNDSGTGNWNADGGPHGTHVAGTIAAVDNGIGVVGMAPGVPLHIIKVFNAAGWGYSSDLAQAANLCAAAGANIISMSLGGGAPSSAEENAFISFNNNGGLVLAAAGNDGNTTRSYPAGYDSVMMIGANDGDNNIASFSQFPSCGSNENTCVEVTAGGVDTLSTFPSGAGVSSDVTADGAAVGSIAMENSATGSASGATYFMGTAEAVDSAASGKVCLIDRGNISFFDKVNNCENSGGIGAIIINNVAGSLSGTLGDTNTTTIPATGVALEDRATMLAAANASVSIVSSQYGFLSGTSMATPTVSGVAALVWSNHPACTGAEIRNALKMSAEDGGDPGKDVKFGYGIVKAKAASDYLATQSCGGGNPPTNNAPSASFSFSCNDLSCSFDGSGSSDSDGSVVSYGWSFGATGVTANNTFASAGTYSVTLTVTDDDGATDAETQSVTVTDGSGPAIDLTFDGLTRKGFLKVRWTGATSSRVDIFRDGVKIKTTRNDGKWNDKDISVGTTYSYQVCEQNTNNCSATETVTP